MELQYRQGNVLLLRIEDLPAGAQEEKIDDRIVLDLGQTSISASFAKAYRFSEFRFIKVLKNALLEHRGLGPIDIPAACYQVINLQYKTDPWPGWLPPWEFDVSGYSIVESEDTEYLVRLWQDLGKPHVDNVSDKLMKLLDAHRFECGAVINSDGEFYVRAGDFAGFGSEGLVSALLGPYGSAKATFQYLRSQDLLPRMWFQDEKIAILDKVGPMLAVVVFGWSKDTDALRRYELSKEVARNIKETYPW